jgi:hypothetical protein
MCDFLFQQNANESPEKRLTLATLVKEHALPPDYLVQPVCPILSYPILSYPRTCDVGCSGNKHQQTQLQEVKRSISMCSANDAAVVADDTWCYFASETFVLVRLELVSGLLASRLDLASSFAHRSRLVDLFRIARLVGPRRLLDVETRTVEAGDDAVEAGDEDCWPSLWPICSQIFLGSLGSVSQRGVVCHGGCFCSCSW